MSSLTFLQRCNNNTIRISLVSNLLHFCWPYCPSFSWEHPRGKRWALPPARTLQTHRSWSYRFGSRQRSSLMEDVLFIIETSKLTLTIDRWSYHGGGSPEESQQTEGTENYLNECKSNELKWDYLVKLSKPRKSTRTMEVRAIYAAINKSIK